MTYFAALLREHVGRIHPQFHKLESRCWSASVEQCEELWSQHSYFNTPNELNLYSEILCLLISSD